MIILLSILFLLVLYFPSIEYNGIDISPDFTLLIIIIISLKSGQKSATVIGFLIGFIKDLITQYSSLGFLSLLTTCFGYSIGNLKVIRDTTMKYSLLTILIFLYFFVEYFLRYSESYFFYFKFSFIRTVSTLLVFLILRKTFTIFFKSIEK